MKLQTLVIFLLFNSNVNAQFNIENVSGLYVNFSASTDWRLNLFSDKTFEYYASGHFGFDDTIRGTYKFSDSIIYTRIYDKNKKDSINYFSYKIESDSCLIEMPLNQKFCHQNYFPPAEAKTSTKLVNLKDSASLAEILNKMSICEKVDLAEKYIHEIIKSNGHSNLILFSIAKHSKTKILIQAINGNMIVPDDRIIMDLKDQLNSIRQKNGCSPL